MTAFCNFTEYEKAKFILEFIQIWFETCCEYFNSIDISRCLNSHLNVIMLQAKISPCAQNECNKVFSKTNNS